MPLLYYDCNRETKNKLEDENKHFLMHVQQVYLMKKKKKGNRKRILLWLYTLNNFPLFSHSSLFDFVCFVYSLETFKVESSFPCFFNINSYTFVLYLIFQLYTICVIKHLRQRIKTKLPIILYNKCALHYLNTCAKQQQLC